MEEEQLALRQRALVRMMGLCARREWAASDLVAKLQKMELSPQSIAWVMEQLQRENYQSDLRYAVAFSRDKARLSAWGARKIAFALRQKGIDAEVIREAWAEVDEPEAQKHMATALDAKWAALERQGKAGDDLYRRLVAYATQRGYGWEEVQQYWKEKQNNRKV